MAGFIHINDNATWSVANWVYWGILDHLIEVLIDDSEAMRCVEECKWAQSMSFPMLRAFAADTNSPAVVPEKVFDFAPPAKSEISTSSPASLK